VTRGGGDENAAATATATISATPPLYAPFPAGNYVGLLGDQ
jgi:hypothetical protein